MKRIILILSILLIASPCFARMSLMQLAGSVPAAASCSSPDSGGVANATAILGGAANLLYVGFSFTSSGAYTLKSFTLNLLKAGDPNTNGITTVSAYVCPDSSAKPPANLTGCQIMDTTISNPSANLTTSATAKRFALAAGYSISASTRYHLVLAVNASSGADANTVRAVYVSSGTEKYNKTADISAWTTDDGTATGTFTTSTCTDQ